MDLPTPYTLHTRAYAGAVTDAHGNQSDVWSDPVEWLVHGYASGANDEPDRPTRVDLSIVLWTVYAPVDGLPGPRDMVVLDAVEYAIEGDPRDYSHDPWGHHVGGGVVYLRKVDG